MATAELARQPASVPLSRLLKPVRRKEAVEAARKYRLVGVRWYGEGPFLREVRAGRDLKTAWLYRLEAGDFIYNRLFGWKGSFGVVGQDLDGAYVSGEFPTFRVDDQVADSEYIWRWFSQRRIWQRVEDRSTGSTRASRLRLKEEEFLAFEVPCPPLMEQKEIAKALRTIRAARDGSRAVIAAAMDLRRSMMQHLFTYGLATVAEIADVELKGSPFGMVPRQWPIVHFGELVTIQNGQVDPRREPFASMPHVGPENIEAETGRLLGTATPLELNLISGKYPFTSADVLYSKIRPYLRKATLPDFSGVCSADMYPLRPRTPQLSRDFLFYVLLTPGFTAQVISLQSRTGIPKVNRQQLASVAFPLPSPSEQKAIYDALTAIDKRLQRERARSAALDAVFGATLCDLMEGTRHLSLPIARPNGTK